MSAEMQAASDDWSSSAPRACATASAPCSSVAPGDSQINPETVEEADVFALHAEGGQACVQVFFFRAGQNWGNRAYFPRVDKTDEDAGDHGRLPGPVLRGQADPRLILVSTSRPNASCWPRPSPSRPAARWRSPGPSAARSASWSTTP